MSPNNSSCEVNTLLLLESSKSPVNAVTISLFEHCLFENNLLNTKVLLCNNALNIVFTLSPTVKVSVIAIFSIFLALSLSLDAFFSTISAYVSDIVSFFYSFSSFCFGSSITSGSLNITVLLF